MIQNFIWVRSNQKWIIWMWNVGVQVLLMLYELGGNKSLHCLFFYPPADSSTPDPWHLSAPQTCALCVFTTSPDMFPHDSVFVFVCVFVFVFVFVFTFEFVFVFVFYLYIWHLSAPETALCDVHLICFHTIPILHLKLSIGKNVYKISNVICIQFVKMNTIGWNTSS